MIAPQPLAQPTYDCPATLNDRQVVDFCRNGFLVLPAVVPDEINRRVVDYLGAHHEHEPSGIIGQPIFVEGVLKNPQAAGAVRSLLGANFTLPNLMSNHRGPMPWPHGGGWHRDGASVYTPRLDYLQVFYYPEACTDGMGPTEVLPGSHFMRTKSTLMSHYGKIAGAVSTAGPAGTIFLTVYSIWHRRTRSTIDGKGRVRNLLKYNYWRTAEPKRDWIVDPALDFNTLDFDPPTAQLFEQFQGALAASEMFCWLCGLQNEHHRWGGQAWPIVPGARQMGMPPALQQNTRSTARSNANL